VYDHNSVFKDKLIGQCEFQLPSQFNVLQRDTLDMLDKKGHLAGVVVLNSIIVSSANSINHLKQF